MIAKLKGRVDSLGTDWAVIDVGGVGYLVFCSGRTLARLAVGESAAVEIETHVREDHIHLYGFADTVERDWYRLLTTVQGVGSRVALGVLGVLQPDDLLRAIAAADKAAVSRAPGVGPKLAGRIVSELKDKAGAQALGAAAQQGVSAAAEGSPAVVGSGVVSEAASALVNLGYSPSDALGAVAKAAEQLGDDSGVEELIRAGLKELAPADARGA